MLGRGARKKRAAEQAVFNIRRVSSAVSDATMRQESGRANGSAVSRPGRHKGSARRSGGHR